MANRKCVPQNIDSKETSPQLFRKRVPVKLQVFVEGRSKEAVNASFDNLVDLLGKELPLKLRSGRGRTTTINVEPRA